MAHWFTPEELEERRKYIGASDTPKIMNGDWYELWLEKTGKAPPKDLTDIFAVQLGLVTEDLNLDWYARRTGYPVTRRGEAVVSPRYPFLRCTLDGWCAKIGGPIQAKHVNCRSQIEVVRDRYYPQVTTEMICTGARSGILSVIIGTDEPIREPIELDDFYAEELVSRCAEFWGYVTSGKEPPGAPASQSPPLPINKMRIVDMKGNNRWATYAVDWVENKSKAETFVAAAAGLKALVESDVREAFGHGITIKRDKRGLSIKKDE